MGEKIEKLSLDEMIELAGQVTNWKYKMDKYCGYIKNGNKKNIEITISHTTLFTYEIDVYRDDICVGSNFYMCGESKSRVKKLYQNIKSNLKQREQQQKKERKKKYKKKQEKAINYTRDLVKEIKLDLKNLK